MNAKRLAAAAAALSLLCGTAVAGQERAQPRSGTEAQVPHGVGATGNDFLILERAPTQGQPSAEDMLMMQMLLLQLLMMQSESPGGETPINVPNATPGVAI